MKFVLDEQKKKLTGRSALVEFTAIGSNPIDVVVSEDEWFGFLGRRRRRVRARSCSTFSGHWRRLSKVPLLLLCVCARCCFELFRVLPCPCPSYTVRFGYLWSRDKWIGPREALPRVCFILGFYERPIGLYNLKARHHFLNKIFNYIHNYTCISNLKKKKK